MENDPYRAPKSNLDKVDDHPSNRLAWKIFFWLMAALFAVAVYLLPYYKAVSLWDYVDILLSVFILAGLFGFAYYRPLITLVFWRYFFYLALFESIFYAFLAPLLGLVRFGEQSRFDGSYLFEMGLVVLLLRAIYLYAYRRPFIWERQLRAKPDA